MNNLNQGGLAAAAGVDEDPLDAAVETQDEIRTAAMRPATAMKRLEEARQRLIDSRTPQPGQRNFRLAQAFLSPTKTGTFGEQMGMVAGAQADYQSGEQKRLGEIDRELLDAELSLERLHQGRDRSKAFAPEDYLNPWTGEIYQAIPHVDRDGIVTQQWLGKKPDEDLLQDLQPLSSLDPAIQREIAEGQSYGKARGAQDAEMISSALEAQTLIGEMEDALKILDNADTKGLGTGGLQALYSRVANFAGIDTEYVQDLGELNNLLGMRIVDGFKHFKGQLSDGERKFMVQLEADITKGTEVNRRIIKRGMKLLKRRQDKGIRAATRKRDEPMLEELGGGPKDEPVIPVDVAAPVVGDLSELSDEDIAAQIEALQAGAP